MSTRSMAVAPGEGKSTFETSMGQSSPSSGWMRSELVRPLVCFLLAMSRPEATSISSRPG
eukprot:4374622-Heterocapsa_arctica.AAC.1